MKRGKAAVHWSCYFLFLTAAWATMKIGISNSYASYPLLSSSKITVSQFTSLAKRNMNNDPKDIRTYDELEEVTSNFEVQCSIVIRGSQIESLGQIKKINGTLGLCDSTISSLGELEGIDGEFWISNHDLILPLQSLGKLKHVAGDVRLRYSQVESLGELTEVGGNLNLRDTPLQSFGKLKIVQGKLFLPKRLKDSMALEAIEVQDKIRFWTDANIPETTVQSSNDINTISERTVPQWDFEYIMSTAQLERQTSAVKEFYSYFKELTLNGHKVELKGYDNYIFALVIEFKSGLANQFNLPTLQTHFENISIWYPTAKAYLADVFIDQITKEPEFEQLAWAVEFFQTGLNSDNINKLVDLFSFDQLSTLFSSSSPFEFSLVNWKVEQMEAAKAFESAWLLKKQYGQYDLKEAKKYEKILGKGTADGTVLLHLLGKDCLTSFGHSHQAKVLKAANQEISKTEETKGPFLHSVWWTKLQDLMSETMRNAENEVRVQMSLPRVGEGWVSETELFYFLKDYFTEEEIVQHASPSWLGRQHLDIYFPKHNIAVEYQGKQHFEAIDFFGGEKALLATQERDARKSKLCSEHDCFLIYSLPGDDKMNLIAEIESQMRRIERKE